jgi:hypothetical protein
MALGKQENFDIKRTVTSAAVSVTTTAAFEGASSGIYALNGGKANVINTKANENMIDDKVPEKDKSGAIKALKEIQKIPKGEIQKELGKSLEYNKQKAKHVQLRNEVEKEFDKQISKSVNLKQKAFDSGDIDSAQRHQKRLEKLDALKKVKVDSIKKNEPKVSFRKMGENNVHVLTGDKHGQIAVDLNGGGARGPERIIFDLDSNLNPAYSDFTKTHDYANTKGLNQSDFLKYQKSTTNLFNQKEVILQQEQRFLLSQLLENEAKNESEPDLKED